MEFNDKKSVHDDLSKYCVLSKENSFVEITEWVNGEGFDITIESYDSKLLSLTRGEIDAIVHLSNCLNYK